MRLAKIGITVKTEQPVSFTISEGLARAARILLFFVARRGVGSTDGQMRGTSVSQSVVRPKLGIGRDSDCVWEGTAIHVVVPDCSIFIYLFYFRTERKMAVERYLRWMDVEKGDSRRTPTRGPELELG
jgi:hypothetical protein